MTVSAAFSAWIIASREKTDVEFKLGTLMDEKLALLNVANKLAEGLSNSLFTPDPRDDIYYQNKLFIVHEIGKALDQQKESLETKRKVLLTMEKTWHKVTKEETKKSFTIDG